MRSLAVSILVASVAIMGCRAPCKNTLPPADMLMHPGPGVDGPGPGVMMYQPGVPAPGMTSQVAFVGPEGMTVTWDIGAPGLFEREREVEARVGVPGHEFPGPGQRGRRQHRVRRRPAAR